MKHCYATALYTTEAQVLSVTHARYRMRKITRVVYGRNAENEPICTYKNGRVRS